MATIDYLIDDLQDLQLEKEELESTLKNKEDALDYYKTSVPERTRTYNNLKKRRGGGECIRKWPRRTWDKKDRDKCQADLNTKTASALQSLNDGKGRLSDLEKEVPRLRGDLNGIKSEIDSKQSQIDSYNRMVRRAANQGMSKEQAEEQADKELDKQKAEEASKEQRRKMIRLAMWTVLGLALITGSVIVYRKYIKKKK